MHQIGTASSDLAYGVGWGWGGDGAGVGWWWLRGGEVRLRLGSPGSEGNSGERWLPVDAASGKAEQKQGLRAPHLR